MGVVCRSQKRHGIAVLAGAHVAILLEGRTSCRHKDNEVEAEVIEGLLGGNEVPVMYGIKGSAHDAQPVGPAVIGAKHRQVTLPERSSIDAHRT